MLVKKLVGGLVQVMEQVSWKDLPLPDLSEESVEEEVGDLQNYLMEVPLV